ncbi:hypothetical protein [Chamaesiphon minutus]|uniref:Uncharacterized protein n=1 Tax=Chamaesiphon minutus (strain ATCC 27169 / PCC 6605) TaxID=1173020 RepID=K9UMR6_CHAP6|nr:hypothetical protein [Chamaesiphon minutus]AFY95489.1 hypothetical protein Cha6605_4570 [Chamaesiphon minutus PCC 6605]
MDNIVPESYVSLRNLPIAVSTIETTVLGRFDTVNAKITKLESSTNNLYPQSSELIVIKPQDREQEVKLS